MAEYIPVTYTNCMTCGAPMPDGAHSMNCDTQWAERRDTMQRHALSVPAIQAARERDYWRARYNQLDEQRCAFRAACRTFWFDEIDAHWRYVGAIMAALSLDPLAEQASENYRQASAKLAAMGIPQ